MKTRSFKFNWPTKYYTKCSTKRLLQEQKKESKKLAQAIGGFSRLIVFERLEKIEEILNNRGIIY